MSSLQESSLSAESPIRNSLFSLSAKLEFKKMLDDPVMREKFKKHLDKDFCTENMVFYEAVQQVKNKETSLKVAWFIQEFFTEGGTYELNLPARLLKKVKLGLMDKNADKMQILENAQNEIADLMYHNNFKRFMEAEGLSPMSPSLMSPSSLSSPKPF